MSKENQLSWFSFAPTLFVLMWATGFIGAKYGLPHAGPFSFLSVRYAIVIVVLLVVAFLAHAPWPRSPAEFIHAIFSGFLLHGVYLGGVFLAISLGMSAGISALIVGLQPLMTSVLSGPLLKERITSWHWLGVMLGLIGMSLVLLPKISGSGHGVSSLSLTALVAAFVALFGMTLGTIYQKAFAVKFDLRTGGVLQNIGALVPTGIAAYCLEGFDITWTWEFIGALSWLVLVLSIGAISLLMLIIRHGDVSKVSTLFYLVPPVTVVMAFFLFGERISLTQAAGIALAVFAVAMTRKPMKSVNTGAKK